MDFCQCFLLGPAVAITTGGLLLVSGGLLLVSAFLLGPTVCLVLLLLLLLLPLRLGPCRRDSSVSIRGFHFS